MNNHEIREDRPIIAIDFDGVIHAYSRGWQDGKIYDNVVPGFFAWAQEASKHFALYIYSSRSHDEENRAEMQTWMREQLAERAMPFEIDRILSTFKFCATKPPAFLTIDDRCIQFKGDWNAPELHPQHLKAFKPWINQPDKTRNDSFAASHRERTRSGRQ